MLELAFIPDSTRDEPVWRQLERVLRELIEVSRLLPGERLPPTRELAARLGLARNTVNHAYQALLEDGLLVARVGQGTFVSARPPRLTRLRPGAPAPAPGIAWETLLSREARRAWPPPRWSTEQPGVPTRFDFRGGRVDVGALPIAELRRVWASVVGERLPGLANAFDPLGFGPLREEISLSLVARGIRCEPEDVLVVSGAQQALDLVARVLIDPGAAVALEQPGYFGAIGAFRRVGARLLGVGVDERGLRTDELARLLGRERLRLVYVTPSAQCPTGATLDAARRETLIDLAQEHNVPVFEDDYDSELRYAGPPLPALKTRDPSGRVIYAGTFSKALFPALRVGYVVAARPLLARLALARGFSDLGGDVVAQAVVAELLASGALDRHVRRVRRLQSARRAALLEALARSMPGDTRWTQPVAGHAIWLRLPPGVDPVALAEQAGRAGIAYARGESCTIDDAGRDHLWLSFVNQGTEALREGAALLGELIREQLARRQSA